MLKTPDSALGSEDHPPNVLSIFSEDNGGNDMSGYSKVAGRSSGAAGGLLSA